MNLKMEQLGLHPLASATLCCPCIPLPGRIALYLQQHAAHTFQRVLNACFSARLLGHTTPCMPSQYQARIHKGYARIICSRSLYLRLCLLGWSAVSPLFLRSVRCAKLLHCMPGSLSS